MSAKSDNLIARQEYILQRLQETGGVAVDEICQTLGASIATIRPRFRRPRKPFIAQAHRGGAVVDSSSDPESL
jgi:DeoR/GlpR family transcriptional regulator of sugar metabolism